MLEEALPVTDKVLTPPWAEGVAEDYEFFGVSIDETRDFAAQALTRRLKVIGLVPASASVPALRGRGRSAPCGGFPR